MRELPPYPRDDWRAWAMQMVEYLQNQDIESFEVSPQSVLFAHKLADERAVTDGVVMYDPALGKLVVSIGGVWEVVALEP